MSTLGAFLDVVVDNVGRTTLWIMAAQKTPLSSLSTLVCVIIVCVEWTTMSVLSPKDNSEWKESVFRSSPGTQRALATESS